MVLYVSKKGTPCPCVVQTVAFFQKIRHLVVKSTGLTGHPFRQLPRNVLKTKSILDRGLQAPHFTPRLFWVVADLDIFEKTDRFDWIDAIRFRERPF